MLGIIVALETEISNIFELMDEYHPFSINGFKGYIFKILDHSVVLIFSGVGKTNASAATICLINNFNISSLINIGSSGSICRELVPGMFLIPEIIQYFDVDATEFDYKLNQVPHENKLFNTSQKLNLISKEIVAEYQEKFFNGILGTSDSFITKKNISKFSQDNVSAIDMEACAIAQISAKNNIEFSCIKIITDSIFDDEFSKSQWRKNVVVYSSVPSKIIYNISCKYIYKFFLNK